MGHDKEDSKKTEVFTGRLSREAKSVPANGGGRTPSGADRKSPRTDPQIKFPGAAAGERAKITKTFVAIDLSRISSPLPLGKYFLSKGIRTLRRPRICTCSVTNVKFITESLLSYFSGVIPFSRSRIKNIGTRSFSGSADRGRAAINQLKIPSPIYQHPEEGDRGRTARAPGKAAPSPRMACGPSAGTVTTATCSITSHPNTNSNRDWQRRLNGETYRRTVANAEPVEESVPPRSD